MILPTKMAKPKVFNIQAFESNVIKRVSKASREFKILKSLSMTRPSKIPLKRERRTLLV
ncbi:hypothetical protein [Sulfurimonas sp.]|uniref:hypothetical protein n=1 Tax=Sulfurimonas sp. TaxID=2022749 RepID=UPI002AB0CE9C|nr:hypothetical protein [Sulfurimonas sp.]